MKNFFSFILMLVFICSANQAFCAKHKKSHKRDQTHGIAEQISFLRYEIEKLDNGTSKEKVRKLKEWIHVLECKVVERMQHEQERIERYESELQDINGEECELTEDREEMTEKIRSKIQSSENKINAYQELLQSLDPLKSTIKKR